VFAPPQPEDLEPVADLPEETPLEAEILAGLQPMEDAPAVLAASATQNGPLEMVAGRMTKVPAGHLYKVQWFFTSKLRVRVLCEREPCDTGLLVVANNRSWYNDDDPEAQGTGKGSYVCVTCDAPTLQNMNADIYVFSQTRSWSEAVLYVDNGSGWVQATRRHFGGTLVKVGPLRPLDYVEVQADRHANSSLPFDNNDTHMVLFDPDRPQNGALYNNDRATGQWNPRINVPIYADWSGSNNYVLLGKTGVSSNSNLGVEARIDLVRGPLNADLREAAFPVAGGAGSPIWLNPGRYYAWVYARTDSPVGHGRFNKADLMPTSKCDDFVKLFGSQVVEKIEYFRGQLNTYAFGLAAQREVTTSSGYAYWSTVGSSRTVPLAALGAAPGKGWNLFLVELKVDQAARYRLQVVRPAGWHSDIRFHSRWLVQRNPDASELKVASYNTYHGGDAHEAKMRNASNLLATQGMMSRNPAFVHVRSDQGPWQWDGDIVGTQEMKAVRPPELPQGYDSPPLYFAHADTFVAEAEQMGSLGWSYVKGRDEDYEIGENGLGPLFMSENVWPGGGNSGIYFSPAAKSRADCRDFGRLDYAECQLEGDGGRATTNFAIPGKASARRYGAGPDRPIAVFNIHLEFEDDKWYTLWSTSHHRWKEVNALMDTIDNLLAVDPDAFNSDVTNPGRRSPDFYANRMIIMGDFNMNAHTCGEHYWILEKLRQRYGYAVDVSMLPIANGNHFAMHDRMGDLSRWVSIGEWQANPIYSWNSLFPWWASTFRGQTPGPERKNERYDAIFLVGRGWAYDDPLLEYKVLSDRDHVSPMYPAGGGVEMWREATGSVTDGGTNYAPNYDLGYGRTAGKPALHTDHQPVLARLRVFMR
ncbi:MAG: hypothetical protein DCC55_36185, partial [Chloroflexi bacterium]